MSDPFDRPILFLASSDWRGNAEPLVTAAIEKEGGTILITRGKPGGETQAIWYAVRHNAAVLVLPDAAGELFVYGLVLAVFAGGVPPLFKSICEARGIPYAEVK